MARASKYSDQKLVVLQEIADRVRHHSKVPSVRELADRFQVSPATMHSWLNRLNNEGLVEWTPGRHRSLRVTPQAFQQLSSQDGQSA